MKIRAIIVDDEEPGRKNLESLLLRYCPEVELVGVAASAMDAGMLVKTEKPSLVFLDINMPNINGFGFLELFDKREFAVVFVTAYEEFGIQAVKANAVDYLLKPISITELQLAIKKVEQVIGASSAASLSELPGRLAISHLNGFEIVAITDIIRLEADDNYTTVYIANQSPIVVSRTIKDFELVLDPAIFFRIHKSHIINLNHLKKYSRKDGGTVGMTDGTILEVAKRRQSDFLTQINKSLLTLK